MPDAETTDEDRGPARDLWAAVVVIDGQNAPDRKDIVVRQLTWASHDEAVDYLKRRLPEVVIPEDLSHPERRRIIGRVQPARLYTLWVNGEIVEWPELVPVVDTMAYVVVEWTAVDGPNGVTTNVPGGRKVRLVAGPRPLDAVAA